MPNYDRVSITAIAISRQTYSLIEFLSNCNHLFMCFPALVWCSNNELFKLFELMNAENAQCIPTMRTSLFAETR